MATHGGSEPRRTDSGLIPNFEEKLRAVRPEKTVDFLASPVKQDDPEDLSYPAYAVSRRGYKDLSVMLKRLREIKFDLSDGRFAGLLNSAIDLAESTDPILELLLKNQDLLGRGHAFQVEDDTEQNSFHHAALRPAALSVFVAFETDSRIQDGLLRGDKNQLTPLHHAVKTDKTGMVVRKIVELCPDAITSTDADQNTPLHYLLRTLTLTKRHVTIMRYLVDERRVTKMQLRMCLTTRDVTRHSVMSLLDSMTNPRENPSLPPLKKPLSETSLNHAREMQKTVQEILLQSDFTAEQLRTAYYGDRPEPVFDMSSFLRPNFIDYVKEVANIGVTFRSDIHLVKFPKLTCTDEEPCKYSRGMATEAQESPVYQVVQRGLRENGMETLRKFVLPDCPRHPHSDSLMRTILSDLRLKIMDWSKTDPSIISLLEASPEIEDMHLRSSGHEDILFFWTSDAGLNQFRKLRKLEITILRTHNPDDDELEEIRHEVEGELLQLKLHNDDCEGGSNADCECEFQFTRDSLNVHLEISAPTGEPPGDAEANAEVEAPTEDDMDELDDTDSRDICSKMAHVLRFFRDLRDNPSPVQEVIDSTSAWIKVVIIDSGIATCTPDLKENVWGRNCFSLLSDDGPWFAPKHFHGTMLGSLIRKMNINTKLYPVNVHPGTSQRGVDVDGAIEALKWALAQHEPVDIICTSWSIPMTHARYDELKAVLDAIHSKNILVFSAIDDEYPDEDVLPAHLDTVIAVRAETRSLSEADKSRVDFVIPSEGIEVQLPTYLDQEGKKTTQAQSSYAAAVGAGLASLILLAARCAFHGTARADAVFRSLKGTHRMKQVLNRLTLTKSPKVVQPWEHLPREEMFLQQQEQQVIATLQTLLRIWADIRL